MEMSDDYIMDFNQKIEKEKLNMGNDTMVDDLYMVNLSNLDIVLGVQ